MIVKKKNVVPAAVHKWSESFAIDPVVWPEIFSLPYQVCRETKLQSFQFRILHRIFPCNYYVSRWNKTVDSNCEICKETDTLDHYFYYCVSSSKFWLSLCQWIRSSLDMGISLSVEDVLFGLQAPSKINLFMSSIIVFS